MRRVSRSEWLEGRNGKKREEEEWKRSKSSGRNKASYRAKTLFCRQPFRLDPVLSPFVEAHVEIAWGQRKTIDYFYSDYI
ncbi:hypothetical protein ALC62_00892 [Cyphomyrmex costatus]|uniref:Uncharacterized protein n=1 Tax=Cyphomyrmex costatus TaxID=456900 RepID=A0A195D596_9HYME|nr:hypothetical protein ALC62_00892 [Cyphomyrmex costatus]